MPDVRDAQRDEQGPFDRRNLDTAEIPIKDIKGLYRAEEYPLTDAHARFDRETREKYRHEDLYGQWFSVSTFIDVPLDYAFSYVSNIFSIEEWTYGIRGLTHVGDSLYKGQETWVKDTDIFIKADVHKDAKAIDYHVAWDQKEELWMRHFLRLIDAKGAVNRSGTMISWFGFRHPYYDTKSKSLPSWVKDAQNKKGREWVGNHWRFFRARHKIETDNLRYILEHRYLKKR